METSDAQAIAIDSDGDTYVAGYTSSTTFPGAPPLTPNPTAGFLVKLDNNRNGPLYTVFLGAQISGVAVVKHKGLINGLITYPSLHGGYAVYGREGYFQPGCFRSQAE
jgi:hypothetical protein